MKSFPLALEEALNRIPPVWPLRDYVAVNPFVGLADRHFLEVASLLRRTLHGEILLSSTDALELIRREIVQDEHLLEAIHQARLSVPAPWSAELPTMDPSTVRELLRRPEQYSRRTWVLTVADAFDRWKETNWAGFITEELSKWCSVYFDEGQSSWRMPWQGETFFTAWRSAAQLDANPGLNGLRTFARTVLQLPDTPEAVIEQALDQFGVPDGFRTDFLHRQLLSLPGWSSYAQYQTKKGRSTLLVELLAARLAYDWALWQHASDSGEFKSFWREKMDDMQRFAPDLDLLPRYLVQQAREIAFQRRLFSKIDSAASLESKSTPSWVRAVFCIDVRSEVLRRHLEAQDAGISTSGFAGFFGLPIAHATEEGPTTSQVPVLLAPKYTVREVPVCQSVGSRNSQPAPWSTHQRNWSHAWNAFKTSAISCFTYVETMGLGSGWKLIKESLVQVKAEAESPSVLELGPQASGLGIPDADQIDLAQGILKNLGLTENFPRLVLFCGHGSVTNNNPYAAGLDCGACGGHSGRVNARAAAQLLNQPKVRQGLAERGIAVTDNTYFLAAEHRTTTDEVIFSDLDQVPVPFRDEVQLLTERLAEAGRRCRQERARRLGISPLDSNLDPLVQERSRDWSQVRPEWGLANNAALIAAPRDRTRLCTLEGRVFLHDYEPKRDSAGAVLELILTAPVVVANWINLQYYASTINNALYGSGNKAIHNVVGTFGIWQGNGGDLQTGLPIQSVHDGQQDQHEPLRLTVLLESTRAEVDRVLAQHVHVRDLVRNEWLFLWVREPETGRLWKAQTLGAWTEWRS